MLTYFTAINSIGSPLFLNFLQVAEEKIKMRGCSKPLLLTLLQDYTLLYRSTMALQLPSSVLRRNPEVLIQFQKDLSENEPEIAVLMKSLQNFLIITSNL